MERFIVPIVVVALWFMLWSKDTGLLIFTNVQRSERVCYYVIGPSNPAGQLASYVPAPMPPVRPHLSARFPRALLHRS